MHCASFRGCGRRAALWRTDVKPEKNQSYMTTPSALIAPVFGVPALLAAAPHVLPHMPATVRAGFPSPAQDLPCEAFDLAGYLAPRPETTFTLHVRGDSMRDAGIPHGCLIVVDRSITPRHGHIVVAVVDGEFTVKQLELQAGRCRLLPANSAFAPIELLGEQQLEIWGVVRASVMEHVT